MEQFRFLKWKMYTDAKLLFRDVLGVVKRIPKEYRFELGSQLTRSSFSIMLNMAEGSGKDSAKELNRFLDISLGSLHETLAVLDIFRDCDFISAKEFSSLSERLHEIARQIGGFKKSIH